MALQVNPINFGQKRFLPPQTKEKLQTVLKKMNSETVMTMRGQRFSSSILKKLKLKDNDKTIGTILDSSACLCPQRLITIGQNTIELGKKINLITNNQTGEILKSKKPFFQSWKKTFKQVEAFLTQLQENVDNPNKIEKIKTTLEGITPQGVRKLYSAQKVK